MKLNKLSLKWKLLVIILTFSALVIFVFYLFQILLLDNIYKTKKITQTKTSMNEVYSLVNGSSVDDLLNPDSSLYQKLNDQMENSESYIYVIKQEAVMEDKIVLDLKYSYVFPYTTNSEFADRIIGKHTLTDIYNNMPDSGARFVVFHTGEREEFQRVITEDEGDLKGENIFYCQRVTISNNSRSYLLVIYSRMTPVQPAIETLQTQFLYITLIVVLITVIVVFMLSRSISKPIIDITAAAKSLAEGEFDSNLEISGFKEIAELSETLNYASSELKKTENLQRELLANVSHDLRTPLTLITGYAEMIRDFPGEEVSKNVQIIIDEANRLGFLVNDLLVLSRLSAKTENFNITNVNITEIIESIVRRQQKLLEKDKFEITFKYTEKVEIMADPVKMEQVIYNFISNAVNYSGTSKKIEVMQEIIDGEVKVSVKDYGIGIKSEDLEYVWDRYYRVDKGLQRSTQGTGLGLSIIKGILDYHEFKYGVESTVGEGSTFYFSAKLNKK